MTDNSRAVLVTGAARRIGRATALALAADGWAVAVHYNQSGTEAEDTVKAIEAAGGHAVKVAAELGSESDTADLVERAATGLGRPLTALINNASAFEHDDIETATRQSWDLHMEANLRAPFVLSQAFAAQFAAQFAEAPAGVVGNIVNILDQRVWNLTPEFMSYTLSKAGLWTLTQTLALALAPGVRVNAIGPGPTIASVRQTAAQFAAQNRSVPLGHGATPDEVAATLRFILDAPAMTGQMIALDGGQHLAWSGYGAKDADVE
jgi:NAD(P)-dependent dehydrogenase (short-subunit alcohol dehydrogenase family)